MGQRLLLLVASATLLGCAVEDLPGAMSPPDEMAQFRHSQPATPALTSLTFAPATVAGGAPVTGTVTFNVAVDGALVELTSSNPVVSVPSETVVAQAESSGAFPVTTAAVSSPTIVTITANAPAYTTTLSSTITVIPASGPPIRDSVTITKASWKKGILRVQAASSNPNAILSVYSSASDTFLYTLTNEGGGQYSDVRSWEFKPAGVTVSSNFGGSASQAL
jgi:hypothetical protein